MVIGIDRGHSNNLSTLGTCEGREVSSWWNFSIMQNHKGLMDTDEKFCHFDEVYDGVEGYSANAFILWLFGVKFPLVGIQDGKKLKIRNH